MTRGKITLSIEHGGKTYYGDVATVKSTHMGDGSNGFFTAGFELSGDGWGVTAGSAYVLDDKPEAGSHDRQSTAYGMDFIRQLIKVTGAPTWEKCVGRKVIALRETESGWGSQNVGLANIDTGDAFIYKEHAANWGMK